MNMGGEMVLSSSSFFISVFRFYFSFPNSIYEQHIATFPIGSVFIMWFWTNVRLIFQSSYVGYLPTNFGRRNMSKKYRNKNTWFSF